MEMAAMKNHCKYIQFGFCKYGQNCRKQHVDEICDSEGCEIERCFRRHPKQCKFYLFYRNCKFGSCCKFVHKDLANSHEDVQSMKSKIEELENALKQNEEKVNNLETENDRKLEDLRAFLNEKDAVIENLREEVENLKI